MSVTNGIHHVTAIAGDPQCNVDFYAGVLGLRMVKKTVNFDDPFTYHLYFGDQEGRPGSIMTFFPWGPNGMRGRSGAGQVTVTAFAVPAGALPYWQERLARFGITTGDPQIRFGESLLQFRDADGLHIEIIATENDPRGGAANGIIPEEHAIRGFHSVTLSAAHHEPTISLMTGQLGFQRVVDDGSRFRLAAGDQSAGTIVDVRHQPREPRGVMGIGAVHHVAFRIENDAHQVAIRERLLRLGYQVSPVMDRNYFHSIYFREPGGVLFEGATDPPGFAVDESPETMGSTLRLPPWLEEERRQIERKLPQLLVPEDDGEIGRVTYGQ